MKWHASPDRFFDYDRAATRLHDPLAPAFRKSDNCPKLRALPLFFLNENSRVNWRSCRFWRRVIPMWPRLLG